MQILEYFVKKKKNFFKMPWKPIEQLWNFQIKGNQKGMSAKSNNWPQIGYSSRGKILWRKWLVQVVNWKMDNKLD